jgi:serine phosphatase RsbU (regulator of sigma subunit)
VIESSTLTTAAMRSAEIADVLPALLPDRIVQLTERLTGGPAALYVIDIEGSSACRLTAAAGFPATIEISGALGPEAGPLAVDEVRRNLEAVVPTAVAAPLWVRCRATAMLVASQDPHGALEEIAATVAPYFELASAYTDLIERFRRVRRTSPAAEVQQDLLAPRICPITGGEVAGSLLPAYDVGGDWFDHAENPEGAWLTVADAMGKGVRATAVSTIALAALRGARRSGDSLEECCQAVDDAVLEMAAAEPTFVTAVIATWHAASRTLALVNCGHPAPVLMAADGTTEELRGPVSLPFGVAEPGTRHFERMQRNLAAGDRVIFYSDGITERRTPSGLFGIDGLIVAARTAADPSAAAVTDAIEQAVMSASDEDISDDATQLVLRVD